MGVDVFLIKPDFDDIAIMPPLGLGYLAAMLIHKRVSVDIHDNTLWGYDDKKLAELIMRVDPLVIGITAVTPTINRAFQIAGLAKMVNSGILVVLGGPHPSATIEETLASEYIDVVVTGEGEKTFSEIVLSFKGGNRDFSQIRGCAFKNLHNQVVVTQPDKFLDDLDSLPFPDLDHMPLEPYFKKGVNFGFLQKQSRSIPIIASRGCPSTCIFCQRFLGSKFRVRSAESIVNELSYRKNKLGVTEFNFLDDNFTLNKKRVIEVCDLIHRRELNISFRFPNGVREDFLDEDILSALKSVGCYHLDFGIESGSQRVLDIMKKNKTLGNIEKKVRLCKKMGFKLSSSFLFGTPGETLEDMEKTIKFALSLPLDRACFSVVIPFPGTELRKEAIEKKYLRENSYAYYNPILIDFKPLIETPEWTSGDLLNMIKKANHDFFFRPQQMLKMSFMLTNISNRKRYIQAIRRLWRLMLQH